MSRSRHPISHANRRVMASVARKIIPNLAKSLRKREISDSASGTSSGIRPPQPWLGPWMGWRGHARVQGCSTLKSGAIGYRASALPGADQRSNLLLRVTSFGSTLRVYGVAAGGRLIPVGAGVNRFRFRYAFSDSVRRLGRMPGHRTDDQAPQGIHESLKSRGFTVMP